MGRIVCVDGPAGSGKSTVSRLVAERLGLLYVDSGALYRIMTYLALVEGVDTDDPAAVAAFAQGVTPDFVVKDGRVAYEWKGAEFGDKIRTPAVNAAVSPVSAVPEVRVRVTKWLRDMPALGDVIVEGRDIGSAVFPDSPDRFYLDCDPDERARRRLRENLAKGFTQTEAEVKASLLNRDRIDSTRKTAPLKVPEGAKVIDTTPLSIEGVVNAIVAGLSPRA